MIFSKKHILLYSDNAPSASHTPSINSGFSLPIPSGLSSLLETGGPSLLAGPTTSSTPTSSASLSLDSRIQALFNINLSKPATPPPLPPQPPPPPPPPPPIPHPIESEPNPKSTTLNSPQPPNINPTHFAKLNKSPARTPIESYATSFADIPLPISPLIAPALPVPSVLHPVPDTHNYKHSNFYSQQPKRPAQIPRSLGYNEQVEHKAKEQPKPIRQVELIKREGFKLIRSELKEIVRKDLLKKLIEQCSFKLIDEWEKQTLSVNTTGTLFSIEV